MRTPNSTLPALADRLRRNIVRGKFQPGERLPSCRKLAENLRVNYVSVHRAVGVLTREGFVEDGHVSNQPPHLFRYGIVFPSNPSQYWPPSWQGLNDAALRVEHLGARRRVVPYYNIAGHTDVPDYQRLLHDLHTSRLAGVILVTPVDGCRELVSSLESIPRIQLYVPTPIPNAVSIGIGGWEFLTRGLDYFAARGRKRIAFIDLPGSMWLQGTRLVEEVERRGLTTRPDWIFPVNPQTPDIAEPITRLLMSLPVGERPDGLFVTNAYAVKQATTGLLAAGVRVPEDVEAVASADFPNLMPAVTPVKWLGTDLREGLRLAIELIDRQRRGETVAAFTESPNVFLEELPAADPLTRLAEADRPSSFP